MNECIERGKKVGGEKGGVGKLSKYYIQMKVLVAEPTETREHLQHIVSEFERACDSMELKINAGKSKALALKRIRWGVVRW